MTPSTCEDSTLSSDTTDPLKTVTAPHISTAQQQRPAADSRSTDESLRALAERVGPIHLRVRLGQEDEKEQKLFGHGRTFFHIENWEMAGTFIKNSLNLMQLMPRGRKNAREIQIKHNQIYLQNLPPAFDDYTILHISDSHLDMAEDIPSTLIKAVREVDYDACVWTGDFRGKTHGSYDLAMEGLEKVRAHIKDPVYAILGNHDSIRMVPGMERMGIRVLLNEFETLEREDSKIYLAGLDDPHFYRADNLEKAADSIPQEATSILLAHTPEIYKCAAFANFDIFLCGHTHGGQICLPGGHPVILNVNCPRKFGAGSWHHRQMQGYTSAGSGACVVDVRFNCPPEITLHHLHRKI